MFTSKFWTDAFERTVRAGAWGLVAVFSADAFDLFAMNWEIVANGALVPATLALLTSIAGEKLSPNETGSLHK